MAFGALHMSGLLGSWRGHPRSRCGAGVSHFNHQFVCVKKRYFLFLFLGFCTKRFRSGATSRSYGHVSPLLMSCHRAAQIYKNDCNGRPTEDPYCLLDCVGNFVRSAVWKFMDHGSLFEYSSLAMRFESGQILGLSLTLTTNSEGELSIIEGELQNVDTKFLL